MRRLQLILASLLAAVILIAGCGGTPASDTAGSMAPSGAPSSSEVADGRRSPAPSASTATPQEQEIRRVVDAYIHERTMEGAPYYIDSSATEFAGYEDGIERQDDRTICRARFTSEKDVYHVQFVLAKETGTFVIRRVVLESLNELPIRKTLYNRDALVL